MIPLTTRDAADWSMICAYLRLDDEGRKRVLVSSTVVLWYHRISKCKKGGTNGLKWAFERIYPDVNQAALSKPS